MGYRRICPQKMVKEGKNERGSCHGDTRSQEEDSHSTLRSSSAPCFPGIVTNSWSSASQVSWTRAVVPTNAVKGCGIRHFPRLAMTRRMIRGEVWRTDRYKLWGECLGFEASR